MNDAIRYKLTPVPEQLAVAKMSAEHKKLWMDALRSGDYKQATGSLCDIKSGGYCCLGVLEHAIAGKVELLEGEPLGVPTEEWLKDHGIVFNPYKDYQKCDPRIIFLEEDTMMSGSNWTGGMRISSVNDKGYTFEQIADFLEPLIEEV